jgi:hypothetical protein
VVDRGQALDRIEDAIERANFVRNRRFVLRTQTPYVEIDPAHIDDDYVVPLDNWYGSLRDGFYEMKKRIQSVVLDLDEWNKHLQAFLQSTDPVEAYSDFEEFFHWHESSGGYEFQFQFDVGHDDFINAAIQHRKRLDQLRELGIEAAYLRLDNTIQDYCISDLARRLPLQPHESYVVTIQLDPMSLVVRSLAAEVRTDSAEPSEHWIYRSEISRTGDSVLQVTYYPSRWFRGTETDVLNSSDEKMKEKFVRQYAWCFTRDLMAWIDETLISPRAAQSQIAS